ncbi:hypothetical protein QOT17_019155 [Balamuthia mandrillaris]
MGQQEPTAIPTLTPVTTPVHLSTGTKRKRQESPWDWHANFRLIKLAIKYSNTNKDDRWTQVQEQLDLRHCPQRSIATHFKYYISNWETNGPLSEQKDESVWNVERKKPVPAEGEEARIHQDVVIATHRAAFLAERKEAREIVQRWQASQYCGDSQQRMTTEQSSDFLTTGDMALQKEREEKKAELRQKMEQALSDQKAEAAINKQLVDCLPVIKAAAEASKAIAEKKMELLDLLIIEKKKKEKKKEKKKAKKQKQGR